MPSSTLTFNFVDQQTMDNTYDYLQEYFGGYKATVLDPTSKLQVANPETKQQFVARRITETLKQYAAGIAAKRAAAAAAAAAATAANGVTQILS